MHIYIVDFINYEKITKEFTNVVTEYLNEYGVHYTLVGKKNIAKSKRDLESNSLIIVYNSCNMSTTDKQLVFDFLKKAKEQQILIWPVAFNKDERKPLDIILEMQSYDIYEELRCRKLDENYIREIAMSFSRKIISIVCPTLYTESGEIFLSHKRSDGEDITAKIYDKLIIQAPDINPFRDVVNVKVGEEAQTEVDKVMGNSEIFIFIHTDESAESDWIIKELCFAVLRHIPVLWVQIDNADIDKLRIKPSEKPHLQYKSDDFDDDSAVVKIVDRILQKSFELIMANSNHIFEYIESLEDLFGDKISQDKHKEQMVYKVAVDRKGYHYPQRKIEQVIQVIGRTPTISDASEFEKLFSNYTGDSLIIVSNKIVNSYEQNNVVIESIEDFYDNWNEYINGKDEKKNMEIVISGAFPDCDEEYKQILTDALVIFAKAILKAGYVLTFGAHPTFQEIFFEIAQKINPENVHDNLKMYVSEWFLDDAAKEQYYNERCKLVKCEKQKDRNGSLTKMREAMIQRNEVKALVCLGGKIRQNPKEEGIREEIALAVQRQIPVFLVGSVGGCSNAVATEYKADGWKNLNHVESELNEEFLYSFDYFKLSQKMLDLIK